MISRRLVLAGAVALPAHASPAHASPATSLPAAARPISREDLPWWRERHRAKLAERAGGRIDLLLLGDSITQQYEMAGPPAWHDYRPVWQRFYGDRRALNLGFTGDATCHLLWRLQHGEIDAIAPRAAVLLIGANNFGRLHWSAADTLRGIEAILATLRTRLPRTGIVLLPVLPSDRGPWVAAQTAETNRMLAERYGAGRDPAVTWIDVTALFLRDGRLAPDRFRDPDMTPPAASLHPSPAAQAALAAAIEPRVAGLLGDRDHRV